MLPVAVAAAVVAAVAVEVVVVDATGAQLVVAVGARVWKKEKEKNQILIQNLLAGSNCVFAGWFLRLRNAASSAIRFLFFSLKLSGE